MVIRQEDPGNLQGLRALEEERDLVDLKSKINKGGILPPLFPYFLKRIMISKKWFIQLLNL